jgi:L-2-hydroxyglutarate oxidase LhgO
VSYDVAVIGAGVVGLACARAISATGRSVLVLERHRRFGQETSSRNSGVIHAGIYYAPGSMKATLCVPGNVALYDWCRAHDVPHLACGKYIVATSPAEEPALQDLLRRAHENGAVEVSPSSVDEPDVRAISALFSPRTGIVDVHALMRSFQAAAQADFAWSTRVVAATREARGWTLTTDGGESAGAACVVNAAGLDADEMAALAGFSHTQHFVKGNYFRLRRSRFKRLIYPLPPADLAGVGIHVTLELDGSARLGPDVEPLPDRARDYRVDESRRERFFAAASRYLPHLSLDDLSPDQAGIRPKVKGGDFIVESARDWINLVGIESPGLTCSLVLADRVVALLP